MDFETYNGIRSIADEIATRITIKFGIIVFILILIIVILFAVLYYNKQKSYNNGQNYYIFGRPIMYNTSPNPYINRLDNNQNPFRQVNIPNNYQNTLMLENSPNNYIYSAGFNNDNLKNTVCQQYC